MNIMQNMLRCVTLGRNAAVDAGTLVSAEGNRVVLLPPGPQEFVNLDFEVSLPEDAVVYGDAWERSYADLCWRPVSTDLSAMPWYACFSWDGGNEFMGFGVETGAGALAAWKLMDGGIRLILDVRSGSEPLYLKEPLELCRLVFFRQTAGSAFSAMRKFLKMMCPSPRLPKEPVFGGNNWYYAYGLTDAACVLGDAARVAKWTRGLPVSPYMMVDVGWQPFLLNDDICSGGPYPHGNYRFPRSSGAREADEGHERPPRALVSAAFELSIAARKRVPEKGRARSYRASGVRPNRGRRRAHLLLGL